MAVRIAGEAGVWAAQTGNRLRLVSANDHTHARESSHYVDRAVDFQGEGLSALAAWFERRGYWVLWQVPGHYAHVHVEECPCPYRHEHTDVD